MDDLPAASLLRASLDLPVCIDKDVNMLLRHDIHYFDLDSSGVILGFYIGTGFGNAICIHGKILYGAHGVAGELGHIPMFGRFESCSCGNTGCAENYMSGKALSELQQTVFPQTPINMLFAEHGGHPRLNTFTEELAIPVATEIYILDPETVIIGGGIPQMEGFPSALLERAIYRRARKPYPACGMSVCYSPGDSHNGVTGAVIYGFEMFP